MWSPTKRHKASSGGGETNFSSPASSSATDIFGNKPSNTVFGTNQASEQLMETIRLSVKDLVRDLLGVPLLPKFFRNFEEKYSLAAAGDDSHNNADGDNSSSARRKSITSESTAAIAAMLNAKESAFITSSNTNAAAGSSSSITNQQHEEGGNAGTLFAGIQAIALVPMLRQSVDTICIACVDRLFNLVGPEISMSGLLNDKIANLQKELEMSKEKLQARQDLALQQRTELLKELTAAFEQAASSQTRFDNLLEKCKLLAQHQGKNGVTELFRPIPPPAQKLNPSLRIPVEPVHPQTGTPVIGCQVKQLTEKLEQQWELLDEVDRVKKQSKELERDTAHKLRDASEKLVREKTNALKAKQSEDVLREEVSRLQQKLRQAELMLRAKEHDVELAIMREREHAAGQGRDEKIQKLVRKQQEKEASMRRIQNTECLRMHIADLESHYTQLQERLQIQTGETSTTIRKLEGELTEAKKQLREANNILSGKGEGGSGATGMTGGYAVVVGNRALSASGRRKSKTGERIGARLPAQRRLEQGSDSFGFQVKQLSEQLKSERSSHERMLGERDRKIRERDGEIQSLRDAITKANSIQMALQGEIEALSDRYGRNINIINKSNPSSPDNDLLHPGRRAAFGGGDSDTHSTTSRQSGGRRGTLIVEYENDESESAVSNVSKEKASELEKEHEDDQELIKHLQSEQKRLSQELQSSETKTNELSREVETLLMQMSLRDQEFETKEEALQEKLKELAEKYQEKLDEELMEKSKSSMDIFSSPAGSSRPGSPFSIASSLGKNNNNINKNETEEERKKREKQEQKQLQENEAQRKKLMTMYANQTRSPSDVAEISRLQKLNEQLSSKILNLEQQLLIKAKEAAKEAQKRFVDYGVQVQPLDILNAKRPITLLQRPSMAQYRKEQKQQQQQQQHQQGSGGGDDSQNENETNNLPHYAQRTTHRVKIHDEHDHVIDHLGEHHHYHTGDARHQRYKLRDKNDLKNNQQQDGEEISSPTKTFRRVLSASNSENMKYGKEIFDEFGQKIEGGEENDEVVQGKGISASSSSKNKKGIGNRPIFTGIEDSSSSHRTRPLSATPPGAGGGSKYKNFGAGNLQNSGGNLTRSAQLRAELGSRHRIDVSQQNQSIIIVKKDPNSISSSSENQQQQQQHYVSENENFNYLQQLNNPYKKDRSQSPSSSNNRDNQQQQQVSEFSNIQNTDIANAMDGLIRAAGMTAPPAWIDMTELVLKAQKFVNPSQSSSTSSQETGNYNKKDRVDFLNTYRKHAQHAFSIHAGRCHDLRLGVDERSTQTDDVIIVEPSSSVSVTDMMRPFSSSSNSSSQNENTNYISETNNTSETTATTAISTPYNPVQGSKSTNNFEDEVVAFLVRLADLKQYHRQQQSISTSTTKSSASCDTNIVVATDHHYNKAQQQQGSIITKLQIPPLRFSTKSQQQQIPDEKEQQQQTRPISTLSNYTSATSNTSNQDQFDSNNIPQQRPFSALSDSSTQPATEGFGNIGRSCIVPTSFGTAQLVGTQVSQELQILLKKALTQWNHDTMQKTSRSASSSAAASHNINKKHHNSSSSSGAHAQCQQSEASSGSSALRPRTPLYIPRDPIKESIESGAARQPYPRHPVPNELPLRLAPRVPFPMPPAPDEVDRKYAMDDKHRVSDKSWMLSMDE